ncbi:hypothetical protein IH979_02285 [Patescibacteria group bacterium]|nr:hypothetical protein [Patescibacteria group bacterium]
MEKIEDMSIPMAANTRDACNIEPEDVPVIPVPIKFQERPETITPNPVPIEPPKPVEVQKLPEEKKPAFKARGEEIAATVKTMVDTGKVRVKKILDLIREWLSMIPGVNKFFLEQEAKIKTDKVMDYVEEQRQVSAEQI